MAKSPITLYPANGRLGATVIPLAGRAPERLVGVGFRCWLNGLTSGDIGNWAEAWDTYSGVLGPGHARDVLVDLSVFVRAVSATANRAIEVSPAGCPGFCRDECLAISIIAASQHGDRAALTETTATLIGSGDIGDALIGAQRLAGGLSKRSQRLSPDSICPATCALQMMRRTTRTRH
jgi:hypothetical protein